MESVIWWLQKGGFVQQQLGGKGFGFIVGVGDAEATAP